MSDPALIAEHIGKRYELGESGGFLEQNSVLRRLRGKPASKSGTKTFWALDDVSFRIDQGEAVGIIGHNGAGKSTLLKVLSRITEPTRGKALISGRVASLLEVGTGFHPELTGRENIFMNGSILGMRKAEISRSFDEIVAFAGVDDFVDTPVKRYSSGMYVRLAFSVAAHLEPEVLIIDEVLAVGDIQFQKKCLGKMGDVSRSGRTVLFVSHNMAAVRQLTSRCILMKRGNVFFDGVPEQAIEHYSDAAGAAFMQGADMLEWPRSKWDFLSGSARIASLSFGSRSRVFEAGSDVVVDVTVVVKERIDAMRVSGTIFHAEGEPVGSFFSEESRPIQAGERVTVKVMLQGLKLMPGNYMFGVGLTQGSEFAGFRDIDAIKEVLPFEIAAMSGDDGTLAAWPRGLGPIRFTAPAVDVVAESA